MGDFLRNLMIRSFDRIPDVRPRVPARFETPLNETGNGFDVVTDEQITTPTPPHQPHPTPIADDRPQPPRDSSSGVIQNNPITPHHPPNQRENIIVPPPDHTTAPPETPELSPVQQPREIIKTVRIIEEQPAPAAIIERIPPADTPQPAMTPPPVIPADPPEPSPAPVTVRMIEPAQNQHAPTIAPLLPPMPQPEEPPPAPPDDEAPSSIRVTINSVTVRSQQPPPRPAIKPATSARPAYQPSVSLNDYIKRRGGRSHE